MMEYGNSKKVGSIKKDFKFFTIKNTANQATRQNSSKMNIDFCLSQLKQNKYYTET